MSDLSIAIPANDDGPICRECMRRIKITRDRLSFDEAGIRAYWLGVEVGTTRCENRVLHALVALRGEYISYRALYDVVTGRPGFFAGADAEGYRTNVRSMIKRLRKKLQAIDPEFKAIVNFTSYGYAWKDE